MSPPQPDRSQHHRPQPARLRRTGQMGFFHAASARTVRPARRPRPSPPGWQLVLGRIVRIGFQKRLQLASGRPADLYTGDLVVMACGARYAPDQFEGLAELDANEVDILAAGGVLGRMRERNAKVAPVPGGAARPARRRCRQAHQRRRPCPAAAAGARRHDRDRRRRRLDELEQGQASASLAHGLQRAGFEVAAIKATGTGAFGDCDSFVDSGARFVGDFTDVGIVSNLQRTARAHRGRARQPARPCRRQGCEIAVVELADGVLQQETAALLRRPVVRNHLAGLMFAAPDALAAVGGCAVLNAIGLEAFALAGTSAWRYWARRRPRPPPACACSVATSCSTRPTPARCSPACAHPPSRRRRERGEGGAGEHAPASPTAAARASA